MIFKPHERLEHIESLEQFFRGQQGLEFSVLVSFLQQDIALSICIFEVASTGDEMIPTKMNKRKKKLNLILQQR